MTQLTAALVRPEASVSLCSLRSSRSLRPLRTSGSKSASPDAARFGGSAAMIGAPVPGRRRTRPQRLARRFVAAATQLGAVAALLAATATTLAACGPELRPAVTLKLSQTKASPSDAAVYIDEEYVGPLSIVAMRGVRLPAGTHRITVEKSGYFPWDREVTADRDAIKLNVQLEPIPE